MQFSHGCFFESLFRPYDHAKEYVMESGASDSSYEEWDRERLASEIKKKAKSWGEQYEKDEITEQELKLKVMEIYLPCMITFLFSKSELDALFPFVSVVKVESSFKKR